MSIDRRGFTSLFAGMLGWAAAPGSGRGFTLSPTGDSCDEPEAIRRLQPLPGKVAPITDDERRARLDRARQLMQQSGFRAVLLEPGSTMAYFTGVRWGLSERTFAAVIPAQGEIVWICPGFEEERARELIPAGGEVRVWQEDESPFRLLAQALRDRGAGTGRVGVEEQVRYFVLDGVRREAPGVELVSADQVTAGCRMFKSPAELALMQRASDVTVTAFKTVFPMMQDGMTQYDLSGYMTAAQERLGGSGAWALVGFGEYSAYPHGSVKPQRLRRGDMVLMDAGCSVGGYESDITRTTVFGSPTRRQTEVWNLERKAQDAAFAATRIGATCESVDAAARAVITSAGYGPDYRVPGLPHRTGHGIGMDGHEWTYLVRGNTTPIQPGMCFSNEPTIVIYGEFGVRLEDCMYLTVDGPRFFSPQSPAIDRPFP